MKLRFISTFTLFSIYFLLSGFPSVSQEVIEGSDAASPFQAIVDISGHGNFRTVQDAIDHVPTGRKEPWLIFIKNGRYEELVRIPIDKPFIHLIGQDKDSVVITYKINCSDPERNADKGKSFSKKILNRKDCATVVVDACDFYSENISFENSWGVEEQKGPQALAIKTNNDKMAFYNCKFRSFQDTWMTSTRGMNDRTYATNCWIEGAVDYFYGGGNAYIEKTTLYNVRSGAVIVAPSHREGTKWGFVFDHCIVDGNVAAADGKLKLGRPWHNQPIAVFLNTTMIVIPHKEGWTDMGPSAKMFAEYNSHRADGKTIDLSARRTWYKQSIGEGGKRIDGIKSRLTKKEAEVYNYKDIILDDDGWNPRTYISKAPQPVFEKGSVGTLHWKKNKSAVGFIIYRNNIVAGCSKLPSFAISGQSGVYEVQEVNKYGSLGGKSAKIQYVQ